MMSLHKSTSTFSFLSNLVLFSLTRQTFYFPMASILLKIKFLRQRIFHPFIFFYPKPAYVPPHIPCTYLPERTFLLLSCTQPLCLYLSNCPVLFTVSYNRIIHPKLQPKRFLTKMAALPVSILSQNALHWNPLWYKMLSLQTIKFLHIDFLFLT